MNIQSLNEQAVAAVGEQHAAGAIVSILLEIMPKLMRDKVKVEVMNKKRTEVISYDLCCNFWLVTLNTLVTLGYLNTKVLAAALAANIRLENDTDYSSDLTKAEVDSLSVLNQRNEPLIVDRALIMPEAVKMGNLLIGLLQDNCYYLEAPLLNKHISIVERMDEHGETVRETAYKASEELEAWIAEEINEAKMRAGTKNAAFDFEPMGWEDNSTGIHPEFKGKLCKYLKQGEFISSKVLEAVNKVQSTKLLPREDFKVFARLCLTNPEYVEKVVGDKYEDINLSTVKQASKLLKFKEFIAYPEAVWFRVMLDQRGRMYTLGGSSQPQGTSFDKYAYRFDTFEPLTERGLWWIKFALARDCGLVENDGVLYTREEQVAWTEEFMKSNLFFSINSLKESVDVIGNWDRADAFAAYILIMKLKETTNVSLEKVNGADIYIQMDGTANGLQWMSMLTQDNKSAMLTNAIDNPSMRPKDPYFEIPKVAMKFAQPKIAELIKLGGRKMAKGPIMVAQYGASKQSIADNFSVNLAKLRKQGTFIPYVFTVNGKNVRTADLLANAFETAAQQLTPALSVFLLTVKQAVTDWHAVTDAPVCWTTYDGWEVKQQYRMDVLNKRKAGDITCKLRLQRPVDTEGNIRAVPPNFIHSACDSTALREVIRNFDFNLIPIHDAASVGPNHVDELNFVWRNAMADVAESRPLDGLLRNLGVKPITIDNPEWSFDNVRNSTYIIN